MTEYTGNCNITRMVWDIEGTKTWAVLRGALLNPEGQQHAKYCDEDIEECVGLMVDGNFQHFSLKKFGRKTVICGGSSVSWEEFIRSWAVVVVGVNPRPARPRAPAQMVNLTMKALSVDFELLAERLEVARTMYLAKYGVAA